MRKERKTAVYDEELRIEAYRFEGIMQPFPNHFHDYYVLGLVESGQRVLSCRNREYTIEKGSMLLFNPGDNHACVQNDKGSLDYRGINIEGAVMLDLAEEVTGEKELPGFSEHVLSDGEAADYFRRLHRMIMRGSGDLGKEEALLFLISLLMQKYGKPFDHCIPECREEIERACGYMETHFAERIYLDQLCRFAGLSKSTLLRAFTKSKGVTPYRYLETIRVGEAKKLLAEGMEPVEAAIRTGFSDQSHFTNYFSRFIGLTPGSYGEIFCGREKEGKRGMNWAEENGGDIKRQRK